MSRYFEISSKTHKCYNCATKYHNSLDQMHQYWYCDSFRVFKQNCLQWIVCVWSCSAEALQFSILNHVKLKSGLKKKIKIPYHKFPHGNLVNVLMLDQQSETQKYLINNSINLKSSHWMSWNRSIKRLLLHEWLQRSLGCWGFIFCQLTNQSTV